MDRELIDALRSMYVSEPGDGPRLTQLAHPEIEIRPMLTWPGMDVTEFRGPEGLEAYFAELSGAFSQIRYELLDLSEHGDALVAEVTIRAEGRESGLSTTMPSFQVIRVQDGLVRSIEGYATREEALAAVGG